MMLLTQSFGEMRLLRQETSCPHVLKVLNFSSFMDPLLIVCVKMLFCCVIWDIESMYCRVKSLVILAASDVFFIFWFSGYV